MELTAAFFCFTKSMLCEPFSAIFLYPPSYILLAILICSLVFISLARLVTILLASGDPEITIAGLTWGQAGKLTAII